MKVKIAVAILLALGIAVGGSGGSDNKNKESNTPKKVEQKKVAGKEDKKVMQNKVEDRVKDYGCINIYTQLGTGLSNKNLKKNMGRVMVKHLEEIRKREDYKDVVSVYFAFYGETNKGNRKIAGVRFDDNELDNLPSNLEQGQMINLSSSQWFVDGLR